MSSMCSSCAIMVDMMKASMDNSLTFTKLANCILRDGGILDDWTQSYIINLYKGKGDALERGNYTGLKLLEHAMKVLERVIERMITDVVSQKDTAYLWLGHHCYMQCKSYLPLPPPAMGAQSTVFWEGRPC